jgi:hypothetical protein
MNSNILAAVISGAGSMVVAVTALVLNHRGFADLRSEMNARFSGVERRLELIEYRLDIIESDLKQFDRTPARQDTEIARLKDKTGLN